MGLLVLGSLNMDTIEEAVIQERDLAEDEGLPGKIQEAYSNIVFLRRRLDRLAKLQSLLKEKYCSRLNSLSDEVRAIEEQEWELRSLAKQLKRNKERRATINRQIASLERRRKTIREAMKQVAGYERSSDAQVDVIEEEQEVLSQRVHDLEHVLELAKQAELSRHELNTVAQRAHATQRLLKEHEADLSKRTIDLLFEFYIPPRNNRRIKL
jgi:chromosome segregation ATPase